MPNWTEVRVTQANRDIPPIWEQFLSSKEDEKENKFFDFNKLIPMPEELDVMAGGVQDKAIAYYLTDRLTKSAEECNLSAHISNAFCDDWPNEILKRIQEDELSEEEAEKLYQAGRQYVSNKEKYGHYTWYGWCCEHWGTKWNAVDTWFNKDDDPYTLGFSTAWCAPKGIMKELSRRFPDVEIYWGLKYEGDFVENIIRSFRGQLENIKMYQSVWTEDEESGEITQTLWERKKTIPCVSSIPAKGGKSENYYVLPDDFPDLDIVNGVAQNNFGKKVVAASDVTGEVSEAFFSYEYELLEEGEDLEFYEKYM